MHLDVIFIDIEMQVFLILRRKSFVLNNINFQLVAYCWQFDMFYLSFTKKLVFFSNVAKLNA